MTKVQKLISQFIANNPNLDNFVNVVDLITQLDHYSGKPNGRIIKEARDYLVCIGYTKFQTTERVVKITKVCPVCSKEFSDVPSVMKTKTTCGYSCQNTYFRSGPNNPNWKEEAYRTTCFHYHPKQCIVCNERLIVEVHHLDENHDNNEPSNLIPLCPTHHQYWHSKYKHLVEPQILEYIRSWKINNPQVG